MRLVKGVAGSMVVPTTGDLFPPLQISNERALDDLLLVVRGSDGAWVIWKSTPGIFALCVSSTTGMAADPPVLITAES